MEIALHVPSMYDGAVAESNPGKGFHQLAQRRRIVWLAVTRVCIMAALYLQGNTLSPDPTLLLVIALLALQTGG
jgi:hypothetical protein